MKAVVLAFAIAARSAMGLSALAAGDHTSVGTIVKGLAEIRVGASETSVPPAAKPLLKELKHQLRDLIGDVLNEARAPWKTTPEVRQRVEEKLGSEGIKVEGPKELLLAPGTAVPEFAYGGIYSISIEAAPGRDDLIVATTTVAVCCGEDTSLYLFRKVNGKWSLLLADEINGYDSVHAAHGTYSYGISPRNGQSDVFVVAADVSPWCSSNWQTIRYRVLKLGASPYSHRVVMRESRPIYLGVEPPPYQLQVRQNGFALTFRGGGRQDPRGPAPLQVLKYILHNGKVTREP